MLKYISVVALAAASAAIITSAHAQSIERSASVVVDHVNCAEQTEGSVGGAATGAVVGGFVGGLFSKNPIVWAGSALLGGAAGNAVGSTTTYSCQVTVTDNGKPFLTQYVGTNKPIIGQTRVLNILSTGQGVLQ